MTLTYLRSKLKAETILVFTSPFLKFQLSYLHSNLEVKIVFGGQHFSTLEQRFFKITCFRDKFSPKIVLKIMFTQDFFKLDRLSLPTSMSLTFIHRLVHKTQGQNFNCLPKVFTKSPVLAASLVPFDHQAQQC